MTELGRRALLQGGGAMAVPGLGRPAPSRFPYPARPESAPGLGAGGGQTVRARRVIVSGPGDGVFVYTGLPRRGNLQASVNAASTDPYGNATVPGNALYIFGGTVWQAVALAKNGSVPAFAFFIGGATQATPYVQVTGITGSGAVSGGVAQWGAINVGGVYFNIVPPANVPPLPGSGNLVYSDGSALHVSGAVTAIGGTPANQTQVSTDSWNPMSLLNSWTTGGRAAPRYKLVAAPDKGMWLFGSLTAPAGVAAGQVIWDLPAGYTVNSAQSIVCRNQSTNGAVMLSIVPGSPQTLQYQSGAVAGNIIDFNYMASLDG